MAAELIKVYKERFPKLRLIGKCYTESDRANGGFSGKWGEWFANGWFEELEKLGVLPELGGDYLGAMRMIDDKFEYWIGMFFPPETAVPEGYVSADIPEGGVATGWVHGREDNGELYGGEPMDMCIAKFNEQGWQLQDNPWFFERYNCPRFTTPDEQGKVILDYCVYIK
jgi:hypothetical protein